MKRSVVSHRRRSPALKPENYTTTGDVTQRMGYLSRRHPAALTPID